MSARIIARDAWVDTRSRNVRFRAIAGNADGRLSPGHSVTVNVAVGSELTVVQVPNMAVRYDLVGPHVFVLDPLDGAERGTDRARRRPVTPGPEIDQMIVISAGLQVGERVAANGAFKLREGLLVNALPVSRGPETTLVE
jgi:membrane fusion protein (multidrug efflux system)